VSESVPSQLPTDPFAEQSSPLQFGRAEFVGAPAGTACTMCQTPIAGSYFEANGAVVCDGCRAVLAAFGTAGTRTSRFLRALGAGLLAAAAGSALYFLVSKLTGYEFGLIAIVVGFAVGAAVKWGCHGRGGALYQALAIGLTYLAIVSTYVPQIVDAFGADEETQVAGALAPESQPAATAPQEVTLAPQAAAIAEPAPPPTPGGFLIGLAILMVIACVAPFLAGFQNILGLFIIGFGLYEAWKINKRPVITITGPHALARAAAAATTAAS
jgi:hypothetical protein